MIVVPARQHQSRHQSPRAHPRAKVHALTSRTPSQHSIGAPASALTVRKPQTNAKQPADPSTSTNSLHTRSCSHSCAPQTHHPRRCAHLMPYARAPESKFKHPFSRVPARGQARLPKPCAQQHQHRYQPMPHAPRPCARAPVRPKLNHPCRNPSQILATATPPMPNSFSPKRHSPVPPRPASATQARQCKRLGPSPTTVNPQPPPSQPPPATRAPLPEAAVQVPLPIAKKHKHRPQPTPSSNDPQPQPRRLNPATQASLSFAQAPTHSSPYP